MKKILLFALFALISVVVRAEFPEPSDYFITKWDTGTGSTLTIMATGSFNLVWEKADDPSKNGTQSFTSVASSNRPVIDFQTSGVYIIKIAPTSSSAYFSFSCHSTGVTAHADAPKLLEVMQWGTNKWRGAANMFLGCTNMDITATDTPDFSMTTLFTYMFNACENMKGENHNFNAWNLKPTNIQYMFARAKSFNRPIDQWDVSTCTNYARVFYLAESFNQPLNSWNVSVGTRFDLIFYGAKSFNQPLTNWNTQSATNLQQFVNLASSFDQSLGSFNLKSATNLGNMLTASGMSPQNYDATLNGWADNSDTPNNMTLNADSLSYTAAGAVGRDKLVNQKGWTITDKGLLTSVRNLQDEDPMTIKIQDKQILITQVENGDMLHLLDVSGRLCATEVVNDQQAVFCVEKAGVYIIRNITARKHAKVMTR